MLIPFASLYVDIYDLLIQDTYKYFKAFNLSDSDCEIISAFIVFNYGNYEDFKDFLFAHNDRFALKTYLCNYLGAQLREWKRNYSINQSFRRELIPALNSTSDEELSILAQKILAIQGLSIFR